jgi:hypothetical protein
MKPEVILTGMVSTKLSSSGSSLISEEYKASIEEASTNNWNTLVESSANLSHNALGMHTVAMLLQLTKKMTDELWYGVMLPQMSVENFLLNTKKPTSVLFAGACSSPMTRFFMAPENIFDGLKNTSINFVNDASLFLFEKNIKNVYANSSFGYSVYDKSELVSEVDDKFEMIVAHAWDIAFDEEYLNSLVNNLAPGGILVISGANESSSIYSSHYRWHPYYDVHEKLKNFSGISYHFAQFLGTSVFVKS